MQFSSASLVRMRSRLLSPILCHPLRHGRKHLLHAFQPQLSQTSRGFSVPLMSSETSDIPNVTSDTPEAEQNAQQIPVAAAFSHGLRHQISHFEEYGFVVLKGPKEKRSEISQLQSETLSFVESKKESWYLSAFVRAAPCPVLTQRTELLLSVLNSTIGRNRLLLEHFLPPQSPCVELSTVVSFPGSGEQTTHSDISYAEHALVITGFVALSDITFECGPTHLYAGTHTSAFHRTCSVYQRQRRVPTYDGWDSELTDLESMEEIMSIFPQNETDKATTSAETARSAPPVYALLEAGDMLLFDTKIFHFGGANASPKPRALLSFSFQRPDYDGKSRRIEGFTYHLHKSLKGKFQLDSFHELATTMPDQAGSVCLSLMSRSSCISLRACPELTAEVA